MPNGVLIMERPISHFESASVLNNMVSQAEFNKGKAAEIFNEVQNSKRIVVLKNNKPSAIILSPDEYARMAEFEEDCRLLILAEERMRNAKDDDFIPADQLMEDMGITHEDLDNTDDVEIG